MSLAQLNKLSVLQDRALMLGRVRSFFSKRNILEVDCPALSSKASVDAHIDLIETTEGKFLHSSPEYGMKRLLADGMGDIYQMSHVFRSSEKSMKHNPEFMMVEWYRLGFSFEEMIEETLDFIRLFLGDLSSETLTYRQALKTYAGIDYVKAAPDDLMGKIDVIPHAKDKDALLNIILGLYAEPHLGQGKLSVITCFPKSQCALAKTGMIGDEEVSFRFEVYYKGVELANGYFELTDPLEQEKRFIKQNAERAELGKEKLPIDDKFLQALQKGLPDCCGVAVGFDRLMMLRHQTDNIEDVIPFRE